MLCQCRRLWTNKEIIIKFDFLFVCLIYLKVTFYYRQAQLHPIYSSSTTTKTSIIDKHTRWIITSNNTLDWSTTAATIESANASMCRFEPTMSRASFFSASNPYVHFFFFFFLKFRINQIVVLWKIQKYTISFLHLWICLIIHRF